MSEINVEVVGSKAINPIVGNGDTVNVTVNPSGDRGPKGDTGATGPANTLSLGTVVTGIDAAATITGTAPNQTLNLVLPQGATGQTGETGPAGPAGPANSLSIGAVTKGDEASATITGTAPSQTLSLVLPKGDKGDTGAAGPYTTIQTGTVTTGNPGTQAAVQTVTNGGTVTLNFTIPRGIDGTANLGDETPQPLGTASAGTSGFASRADHVHATPVISFASLTGVPSTFAPAAHQHALADVTGLQAALDGKQPVGTYATLVNGTVPSSQLPGFVDDVVEHNTLSAFPATGEVGKLFVARDTNKVYRWSGSTYVEIASSPGSTDAVPEGTTNKYFTVQRAAAAAPVQSVNGKTGDVTIEAGGIAWSSAPSSTTSTTSVGQIAYDANYLYVANAVNQWRRTAIEDWTTPTITINTQPGDQTAVGGEAVFTVVASATQNAELLYQWQRQAGGTGSWVNVTNGLSASLTLTNLQYAVNNGDKYRCVISSGGAGTGGSAVNGWLPAVVVELTPTATVTSDAGTLTVLAAISITVQPQNVTLVSDTTASFSVTATTPGSGLSYQWQSSPDGTNWTAISGATNSSISFTGVTQTGYDQMRYRCVVSSSGYDDVTSNAAKLTVSPITVTTQPQSLTATPGTGSTPNYNATLTVAGTSPAGAPTLQWQVSTDNGSTWSDVSGATSASLALSALTWSDSGKRYRARLNRTGWNEVTSNAATVAVPTDVISVTQQPANTTATVSSFGSTTFTLPSGRWNRVSYANNRWFAMPSNADFGGDYFATSSDGVNWTKRTLALPAPASWSKVLYYNGVYLVWRTANDNVSPRFATSTDGLTWTGQSDAVFRGNGVYLADINVVPGIGFVMQTNTNVSLVSGAFSSDGVTWTECGGGTQALNVGGGPSVWSSAQIGDRTVWVTGAVTLSGSVYSYGIMTQVGTGTPVYTGLGSNNFSAPASTIAAHGEYFVFLDGANGTGRVLSYANATTTTPTTVATVNSLPGSTRVVGIYPVGSRWIAVGNSGFYTSNDQGANWALRASVTVGGGSGTVVGRFFANGSRITFRMTDTSNNTYYTTDDGGLTWTTRTASWPTGAASISTAIPPFTVGGSIVYQSANNSAGNTFGGSIVNPGGLTSASFSASASTLFGAPDLQWQKSTDGGATWSDIADATGSPLALTPGSADNGSRYRARFTKSQYTTVNSNAAILTVP